MIDIDEVEADCRLADLHLAFARPGKVDLLTELDRAGPADEAHDRLDGGGLAHTVAPEEGGDPGRRHLQVDVLDDPEPTILGNPVSAMVTFELFVRPALLRMAGHSAIFPPVVEVQVPDGYPIRPGLTHFVRVRLKRAGRRTRPVATTSRRPVNQSPTMGSSPAPS